MSKYNNVDYLTLPKQVEKNRTDILLLDEFIEKNGYKLFTANVNILTPIYIYKSDLVDIDKEPAIGDLVLGVDGYAAQIIDIGLDMLVLGVKTAFSSQGPQGEQGPMGPTGPQGIQGPQGVQGAKGIDGTSFVISGTVDEVGDLPSGQPVGTAYFVGTSAPRSVYSFDGSVWTNQGTLQGPQGEQGIQGVQGEQGEQGIQGLQGAKGDKGDKGDQGIQGIQGLKGDTGNTGAKGDKGDTGDTGAKGDKGDKGDQGIQGIQGIQGERGNQGAAGGDKMYSVSVGNILSTSELTFPFYLKTTTNTFSVEQNSVVVALDNINIYYYFSFESGQYYLRSNGPAGTILANHYSAFEVISAGNVLLYRVEPLLP